MASERRACAGTNLRGEPCRAVIVLANGYCAVHSPSRRPVPAGAKPSGLDAEGGWTPQFPEQRPPFAPGNGLSLKAGDRALLRLKPRAAEIAVELRELVPVWSPAFGPVVDACSMVGAQVEASFSALADAVDPESVKWLDERARRWATLYVRYLGELGLTPTSLAQRGLDLSQAARSEQLRRHIEERYGGEGDG